MTRPAFGRNLMATIECVQNRPQMATVTPGVFKKSEKDESIISKIKFEDVDYDLEEKDIRTKVLKKIKSVKEILDISESKVVVTGGNGVGSKENVTLLIDYQKFLVTR